MWKDSPINRSFVNFCNNSFVTIKIKNPDNNQDLFNCFGGSEASH